MYKKHMPLSQAFQLVKQSRPETMPNSNFLKQLVEYQNQLGLHDIDISFCDQLSQLYDTLLAPSK